jgi:hypothetical protein
LLTTPAAREFRLTRDGVQCGEVGLGVGGVALLERSSSPSGAPRWGVRSHGLKHEQITAAYNRRYLSIPGSPLTREVVSSMDFNAQREAGLAALREVGVLK